MENVVKVSTIKVRMDYETNQPVIRITRDRLSENEIDRMINAFIEKAGLPGAIIYVAYPHTDTNVVDIRCETLQQE